MAVVACFHTNGLCPAGVCVMLNSSLYRLVIPDNGRRGLPWVPLQLQDTISSTVNMAFASLRASVVGLSAYIHRDRSNSGGR